MPESPSDQELLTGCLDGSQESWNIFVERFSKLIYWSIHRTLETYSFKGQTDLPHEIFQDFFTGFLEKDKLQKLKETSSVRKFLTVMACHSTVDRIKAIGKTEKRIDPEEDPDSLIRDKSYNPGLGAVSGERAALVAKALQGLSPKERLCVEWYYLDGKTHREISEVLGISQDTISSLIRRSKDKLKKIFLENGISE